MAGIRNVRRFSAALAGALAIPMWCGAASATDPVVPANVRIDVVLTTPLTSQTAHVGDHFAFKTEKDATLGTVALPAGTPGNGRIAAVTPAHDKQQGSLVLQADDLTLSSGARVWVNIDPSKKPTGRLSDKHTHFYVLPIPIGIVPATFTSVSGNLILDAGTAFRVVTIPPRASPAPLVTAPPTAAASPAAPPAPSPVPAPSPTGR